MAKYSTQIKQKLIHTIKEMSRHPKDFVQNPKKDFTRHRKLSFECMMNFILAMNGNSLYTELMSYFNYDIKTASTSAFIQQRSKIRLMHLSIYFNSLPPHTISINTFEDIDFSLLMAQRLILHIILMMKKRTLNLQRLKRAITPFI